MNVAAIILGMAALGGVGIRLSGSPLPPVAIGHGLIAVTGLATLAYAAVDPGIPRMALIALGVMVLAAMGGSVMFFLFHLRGRALPILFMLGHAALASAGRNAALHGLSSVNLNAFARSAVFCDRRMGSPK